jgi:hypothetical protein
MIKMWWNRIRLFPLKSIFQREIYIVSIPQTRGLVHCKVVGEMKLTHFGKLKL